MQESRDIGAVSLLLFVLALLLFIFLPHCLAVLVSSLPIFAAAVLVVIVRFLACLSACVCAALSVYISLSSTLSLLTSHFVVSSLLSLLVRGAVPCAASDRVRISRRNYYLLS